VFDDLVGGFGWEGAADKAVRTVVVYLAIYLLLRLAGKRQLAQLSTFDFVVILLLSNVVQNAIIGPENSLVGGLIGATILVVFNFLVVFFIFLNPRLERDLRGRSTTLIHHGELQPAGMRRELVSQSELDAALRRHGYEGTGVVEEAVLDPEGALTVRRKPEPTIADVLRRLDELERRLARSPR
jgi:uncharacterized membrane protein YcaP (DUF421 family)